MNKRISCWHLLKDLSPGTFTLVNYNEWVKVFSLTLDLETWILGIPQKQNHKWGHILHVTNFINLQLEVQLLNDFNSHVVDIFQ